VKMLCRLLAIAALSLTVANAASAQSMFGDPSVSFGYQLLHIPDETFPLGFNLDASGTMSNGVGLVGEVGWSKDDQDELGVGGTLNFVHYGAGPRWNFGNIMVDAPARPFVQVLAGGVHTAAATNLSNDSDNAFMLQPGFGVFVPIAPNWGAVGQVDYRRVFFAEEHDNEWRLVLGFRFGGR
jgi:hypothetical protein